MEVFHPYDFFFHGFLNDYFKEYWSNEITACVFKNGSNAFPPEIMSKFLNIVKLRLIFLKKHLVPNNLYIALEHLQIAMLYNSLCLFKEVEEHMAKGIIDFTPLHIIYYISMKLVNKIFGIYLWYLTFSLFITTPR